MSQRVVFRDLVDDSLASLVERKTRTILTALGVVLGVGVLITVLGVTSTVSAQIGATFDVLSSTEVVVSQEADPVRIRAEAIPQGAEERIEDVSGVVAAGVAWRVNSAPEAAVSQLADAAQPVDVWAADPGALSVARASTSYGRLYDIFAERAAMPVAVVGPGAARSLGLRDLSGRPAVFVGTRPLQVVGLLDAVDRHPELLNAIIVPTSTAVSYWGQPSAEGAGRLWVEVQPGAAQVVAAQLPVAIDPVVPARYVAQAPADPSTLRLAIDRNLQQLFLLLAGICLIVGMVGIGNNALVNVMERTGEIGLRRALGARPRDIALQFLVESAAVGIAGGIAGATAATAVVVGICVAQDWTAVIPTVWIFLGPIIGGLVGIAAGLYPALKASRLEPVDAIRSGGI